MPTRRATMKYPRCLRISLLMASVSLFVVGLVSAQGVDTPPLSPSVKADAEYLLSTTELMDAQFGMAVEAVEENSETLTVRTTGAEFRFERRASCLHLHQRLGKSREAGRVTFPHGTLNRLKVERKGTGAVVLSSQNGAVKMRINGDSLLMLKSVSGLELSYTTSFAPGMVRQHRGNVLVLDEWGGMGSYVATGRSDAMAIWSEAKDSGGPKVRYALKPDQILWLAIAPPKPFDWQASCRDRVVWHWSRKTGYPSDKQIEKWSQYGNVLLQQSEMMLWKDWALRFVPRQGPAEFERVNRTCERFGMRNIVYTSPYYFLSGTGKENRAVNSFDNFAVTGFGPDDSRGLNWPIFLAEIRRVMRDYKPDGLYFDGIYSSVVRTYLLARKARGVVGDQGLLEYHATISPPGGGVYLPQIDTYFNFILRGENSQKTYRNEKYLRYFVSTHNISNAIGVLCNNNAFRLNEDFIAGLLDANIRLHWMPSWLSDYRQEAMNTLYWPALNDSLRLRVDTASAVRQVRLAALRKAVRFNQALLRDVNVVLPVAPGVTIRASDPPATELADGWRVHFGPNRESTISIGKEGIAITARENTSAYLERAIPADTVAMSCRARCLEQGGASWGPGLVLQSGDNWWRINVRSDGRIGVDRAAGQLVFGGHKQGKWHWIRLRLAGEFLLYEVSSDGVLWRSLQMDRVGPLAGDKRMLIGKVANNGGCTDYKQLGGLGKSNITAVQVFAGKLGQGQD